MSIQVAELWSYPIKSCGGVGLEQATMGPTGFQLDREFMLIDEQGFLTQRREPALARVKIDILSDHLLVSIPEVGTAAIDTNYNPYLPLIETEVHHKKVVGRVQGGCAQQLFSQLLSREVKLLRSSREHPRYVKDAYRRDGATNQVAFGDGFPYLLTSRASLTEQHRITNMPNVTVPMDRFRPNIVIDGPDLTPYEEDSWKKFRADEFGAFVVRACDRCQIPTVVQTGEWAGNQGDIAVKARFLKSRAGTDLADPDKSCGRFFGQNLNPEINSSGQQIQVGTQICVTDRAGSNIELRAA